MNATATPSRPALRRLRVAAQILLGVVLVNAGISHLTVARTEFQAQVPLWVPLDPDLVVLMSGVVEITLGLALLSVWTRRFRPWVGLVAAAFFVAIFPGNISQLVTHTDAFGLDSDAARWARLPFQPLLVAWALWASTAWWTWRHARRSGSDARPAVGAS